MKECSKCKVEKPSCEYHKNGIWGLRPDCKECRAKSCSVFYWANRSYLSKKARQYHLKMRYKTSEDEVSSLKKLQNNLCLICLKENDLHVDHCHETGKVRGLLCGNCNRALGMLKENINNFERAIMYLRNNK